MHLFELTKSYDLVYNWFNILKNDKIEIIAYVIMPNHVHCILYFPEAGCTRTSADMQPGLRAAGHPCN
jgi:hypothetical protein